MTTQTKEEAAATVDEYNKQQNDPVYLAELQAADKANADALVAYQQDKSKFSEEEAKAMIEYENKVIGEKQYESAYEIYNDVKKPGKGMNPSAAGSLVGMYWTSCGRIVWL